MDTPVDPTRHHVLIVDHEVVSRTLLCQHLSLAGFGLDVVGDGWAALGRARGTTFDLIILEAQLPGLNGIALCRALRTRSANRSTPIVMLTARDTELDRVLGLDSGADDCLTKPFGMRELLARVRAILRRSTRGADETVAFCARYLRERDVIVKDDGRHVIVRGAPVVLTRHEVAVLCLLAERPGVVFSRAALLAKVWNGEMRVTERTVDTVVSRLRRKIERDTQHPQLILTTWSVGYKFVDSEAACTIHDVRAPMAAARRATSAMSL